MPNAPNLERSPGQIVQIGISLLLAIGTSGWAGAVALPDPSQMAASEGSVLLRPGVIVAPHRQAVYAMAPSGEIEAIHLALGGLTWRSAEGSKPLALHGHLLVALAEPKQFDEPAQVVVLDTEGRGRRVLQSPIGLPASAWRQIDEGLGSALHTEADASGAQIIVRWESTRQPIYGAAAMAVAGGNTRNPEAPEIERMRGALRLDLATGGTLPIGQGPDAPSLAPARPRILEGNDRLADLRDDGIQFLSSDGQHVLTSTRIADERVWDRYRWRIHERATGAVVGLVHARRSHADFVVSGDTLLYVTLPALRRLRGDERDGSASDTWSETHLGLRAVDLLSGAEIWNRPIRDTRYYGPFPP